MVSPRLRARNMCAQSQERLLLSPFSQTCRTHTGDEPMEPNSRLALSNRPLWRSSCSTCSTSCADLTDSAQGYGPANLIALLRLLRGNLNGLDLSQLCIRGAYLQGIEMQEASLAEALIRDTVFTEAVSATWGVAISQDGTLWAASGMQGEVRVWGEGGRTLHLMWQAHTDLVQALAFSPDGRRLASGSRDGTVKLWDVEACSRGASPSDALLWMDRHNFPHNLAFSPDGSLLASSGMDAIVPLWDTESGMILQRLEHPANVFEVAWSPDGHLLASTCFDGQLRLWERQEAEPLASARDPLPANQLGDESGVEPGFCV